MPHNRLPSVFENLQIMVLKLVSKKLLLKIKNGNVIAENMGKLYYV